MVRTVGHHVGVLGVLGSRRGARPLLLIAYSLVCGVLAVSGGLIAGRLLGGRWGLPTVGVQATVCAAVVAAAGLGAQRTVDGLLHNRDGWRDMRRRAAGAAACRHDRSVDHSGTRIL